MCVCGFCLSQPCQWNFNIPVLPCPATGLPSCSRSQPPIPLRAPTTCCRCSKSFSVLPSPSQCSQYLPQALLLILYTTSLVFLGGTPKLGTPNSGATIPWCHDTGIHFGAGGFSGRSNISGASLGFWVPWAHLGLEAPG